MYAEGIHYVVLRSNIVFRSKDVFHTEYQDFMKCVYITHICGKHDTEPFLFHKTGKICQPTEILKTDFFHGVSPFNRLLTFGSVCNSFTPYLDLTTSDFIFSSQYQTLPFFTDPCNNSLIIRISNLRPISRSRTLLPFF